MLHPQSAVLIECGHTRLGGDELRAALSSRRLHELDDGLLGRALIPRRQRVLRVGDCRGKSNRGRRQSNECVFEIWFHVILLSSVVWSDHISGRSLSALLRIAWQQMLADASRALGN